MNDAVAQLRRIAAEVPGTTEIPNPTQRPPQPDRPYVLSVRLDSRNTSDVAKQLRTKVASRATSPARPPTGGCGSTSSGRAR